MKFGLFSTTSELEKLHRGFVVGAVVSQTQYTFSVCKKGSYLSGSFMKTRSARNVQSFALGRANVELQGSMCFPPDMSHSLLQSFPSVWSNCVVIYLCIS